MTRAERTAFIRSNILFALEWGFGLTYIGLAEAAGCTPRQARYHAECLAREGVLRLERDCRNRVVVSSVAARRRVMAAAARRAA